MSRTVPQEKTVTGWVGWIMFAAYFMIIGGVFDIMQGLAALFRDQSYFVVAENGLLTFNFTSWGWIHLLFGLAMIGVGVLLLRGSTFARVIAIILVGLNMVSQFAWPNSRWIQPHDVKLNVSRPFSATTK